MLETLVKTFNIPPTTWWWNRLSVEWIFFIEGYLHNVLVKLHKGSKTFYIRALCYGSPRNNESPDKIRLAISTEQPCDVLASSCTCVAGSLGFCNHDVGLIYLVSHYYLTNTKSILDDLVCTSLPQQWHKPRGKYLIRTIDEHGF